MAEAFMTYPPGDVCLRPVMNTPVRTIESRFRPSCELAFDLHPQVRLEPMRALAS